MVLLFFVVVNVTLLVPLMMLVFLRLKSVIVILSAYGPVVRKNREINVLRSMKRYSLPSFTYECVLCATVCKCVCIFNVNKFTTYFMRVLCCYSG